MKTPLTSVLFYKNFKSTTAAAFITLCSISSFGFNANPNLLLPEIILLETNLVQEIKISGTVIDSETNEVLPGANVLIKGTTVGATADMDGKYTLTVPSTEIKSFIIEVSFLGYTTVSKTVNVGSAKELTLNFQLAPSAQALGDILITANKREQTVLKTAMSVQAISGKDIEKLGARDLSDVINFVPGASEVSSADLGRRQYQIRGVTQASGDATVGYYLGDAAFNYYSQSPSAPISRTFDIARVEVLRGPQSTLYGGGAMGGVIKYVPTKPNVYEFEGAASVGANTLKGGDGGYYGDLMLNAPLAKDKLALRVVGGYQYVGGYIEGADGEENINDGKITQLRASLLYKATDKLTFDFTYQINKTDQNAGGLLIALDPPTSFAQSSDDNAITENNWFIGTVAYDFDNFATLSSTTSLIDADNKALITADLSALGLGILTDQVTSPAKAFNNETRLVSNTDSPFQWLLGTFYSDAKEDYSADWSNPMFSFASDRKSKSFSVFGEFSYGFLDGKLIPLIGLRSYSDKRENNTTGSQGELDQKDTFTSINPRFNLSYQPNDKTNYYVNVAKGFRSGRFNLPISIQLQQMEGYPITPAVDSDELWSYEIGTKQKVANNQLLLEVAAYYQNWKDMQNNVQTTVVGTYSVGDVEIPGVDLGITYFPNALEGLSIQAVANFNDAKFKKINPELIIPFGANNGDRIPGVPAWNLGLNTNYIWSLGTSGWNASTLVAFTHTDKQEAIVTGGIESGAQSLLRVRLGVQNDTYGFSLFGNNLLGEEDAIMPGFQTFQAVPTQFGVEFNVKF